MFIAHIAERIRYNGKWRTVLSFQHADEGMANFFAGVALDTLHDRTGKPYTYLVEPANIVESAADVRAMIDEIEAPRSAGVPNLSKVEQMARAMADDDYRRRVGEIAASQSTDRPISSHGPFDGLEFRLSAEQWDQAGNDHPEKVRWMHAALAAEAVCSGR
jgi:hypothetical protein